MGLYTMGPAAELVSALRAILPISCFVETGTFQGVTARWAANEFDRVYTIEASQDLWDSVQPVLSPHENITSLKGCSSFHLARLMPDLPTGCPAERARGNTAGHPNPQSRKVSSGSAASRPQYLRGARSQGAAIILTYQPANTACLRMGRERENTMLCGSNPAQIPANRS